MYDGMQCNVIRRLHIANIVSHCEIILELHEKFNRRCEWTDYEGSGRNSLDCVSLLQDQS